MQRCAEPWRTRVDIPVMVLLVTVTLAIAWLSRTVLVTSDPWHYAQAALNFNPSVDSVRIDPLGIIVPQIPVGAVFGPTLPTFYAFAFLATTLVVAVVYGLARWVGPPLIAALTVVVLVAQPLTLLNLSRGYPDLMAVALNGPT